MNQNSNLKKERYLGIELIKFFCTTCMIIFHSLVWTLGNERFIYSSDPLLIFLNKYPLVILLGLPITLLPTLAGLMFRRYLLVYQARILPMKLKQLLFLPTVMLISSILINICIGGQIIHWDILWLMGASYLIIAISGRIHLLIPALLAICSLLLTYLKISHPFISSWSPFPWFASVVLGFFIGHFYLSTNNIRLFKLVLLAFALIMLLTGISPQLHYLHFGINDIWSEDFFTGSISSWPFVSSLMIFLLLISSRLITQITITPYGLIDSYSRGIFWIFIFINLVGYGLSRIISTYWQYPLLYILPLYCLLLLLISWPVGRICIKMLHDQKYRISFRG